MEIKLTTSTIIYIFKNFFPILISLFWVRFSQKIKYASELSLKGEFVREYHLLIELKNEKLMEHEKFQLDLNMAKLFYYVENQKRFSYLMDELSTKIEKYPKERFFYGVLRAFYFENKNDFVNAKIELEIVYENTNNNIMKMQAYNNIARIETIQGSHTDAQIFYEKSFRLLKDNPIASFFPIVIHNLLMTYAKKNETEKANNLLREYWELVNENKVEELLQYANDMTHYARQINDKQLLEKSYEIVADKIHKIATDSEKFIIDVTQLRMSYNDNINFEQHYQKTLLKIKHEKENLSLEQKLIVIQELRYVISQYITTRKYKESFENDFQWLTQWHLSLEEEIFHKLTIIESSLISVRVFWLNKLIDLNKTKIAYLEKQDEYLPYINKIAINIEETILMYKNSENEKQQINKILHFLDELYSLYIQTGNEKIMDVYKEEMLDKLDKAELLLEKNWKYPGIEEYMISLSWFLWRIKNDKVITQLSHIKPSSFLV